MEKVYTPFPPPASAHGQPPKVLAENEAELQKKVVQHFSASDYTLPRVENGTLTEEEKFWLVRFSLLLVVALLSMPAYAVV